MEGQSEAAPQTRPTLGHCGDPGVGSPSGLQSLGETWNAHMRLKGAGPSGLGYPGPQSL